MKLSRIQKIIRNTAIVIVLLAVLPLMFDMHFSAEKAAHEALEKAGCEDAEYIAQYTVKRGNNDKGSASVEKICFPNMHTGRKKTADGQPAVLLCGKVIGFQRSGRIKNT